MKRLFDAVAAALSLVLLSPLILFIALAVRFSLGSPVFFVQQRPGLGGHLFQMIKFRTMRTTVPGTSGQEDKDRLTPFGAKLRRFSLDELPELWNVLRGDMSLVGPRPLLAEYLPLYSLDQARRHEVRPGITGWAQVNGRNDISWEAKLAYDVWYVENRSFTVDLKILLLTLKKVIRGDGVSQPGHVTSEKFRGPQT
jgi:lipopolysaccharide/colanic/teichoic acid biosynthesis glycosyltransferase